MEEKKYDFNGKVEISTEEYRDLIKSSVENEHSANEYRSKCWSQESEIKKLKEKITAQEKAISNYVQFVNSDGERSQAYKLFILSIQDQENEI